MNVKDSASQAPTLKPRRSSMLLRLLSPFDKKPDINSGPRPLLKGIFGALQTRRASAASPSPEGSRSGTPAYFATDSTLDASNPSSRTSASLPRTPVCPPKPPARSVGAFADLPALSDVVPTQVANNGDAKIERAARKLRGSHASRRRTRSMDARSGLGLPPAPAPEESYLTLFVRRAAILATDIAQAPIVPLTFDVNQGIRPSQRFRDLQQLRAISQRPQVDQAIDWSSLLDNCWREVALSFPAFYAAHLPAAQLGNYLESIPDLVRKGPLLSPRAVRRACEEGMKPLVWGYFDRLALGELAYLEEALLHVGSEESYGIFNIDTAPALQFFDPSRLRPTPRAA